jgi:hypothetical protein
MSNCDDKPEGKEALTTMMPSRWELLQGFCAASIFSLSYYVVPGWYVGTVAIMVFNCLFEYIGLFWVEFELQLHQSQH